ncbi:MAG: SpoVR family protein [Micavibrio sp.]|nr:SpoVR family protein [Micavibrio sp.]
MTEETKDYKKSLEDLLSHYEDGWEIFIKANKAGRWDYPVNKKEASKDIPGLPKTWLDLVETAFGIIAKEKYGLDCYENQIDVISSDQMLDAYASNGMPVSYEHWSFGKQRVMEEQLYRQGKRGLAYEIVINTDPAIAYCMENNSPLMQMLVIAHASFGHNNFFKKNTMFQQHTEAQRIINHLEQLRDFARECEDLYGYEEVEKLFDACHALQYHSVYRYPRKQKPALNDETSKAQALEKKAERFMKPSDDIITRGMKASKNFGEAANSNTPKKQRIGEENILMYLADNAPNLDEWKRKIMRMVAYKSQYFFPQMQTKVMNEGWASFWHITLMNDMEELGLIDDGMYLEFMQSNGGVLFQPDFNPMNPYVLGFAIFNDLKRMCQNPTEEDKEWFPDIAGREDWLNVLKEAMENFKDETFILQYLSPKVIRDHKLLTIHDDSKEDYVEVTAVHNKKGYQEIIESLASTYNFGGLLPNIDVAEYNRNTDRSLILEHHIHKERPLYKKDMDEVLKHMHRLWGYPVILRSVDETGKEWDKMACPPKAANDTGSAPSLGSPF